MTDLIPAPRPVPTTEDRMRDATNPQDPRPAMTFREAREAGLLHPVLAAALPQDSDARTDHTFATYLDRTERNQLDARAACAEAELDEALDDRDTARAEAANLRRELDKANAGRQKLQSELDTMTQVAQSNKRHVAYLTTVIEAIANVEPHIHNGDATEDNCSPYCPGCRIRTAMTTTIDAPSAGLGSAPPRAQDNEKPRIAPFGCDDCSVEHGERHRYAGCPTNLRQIERDADRARP